MSPALAIRVSIVFGLLAWGAVLATYALPILTNSRGAQELVRAILLLHCFRYLGLAFTVPGVVSAELPREFARPAAHGDLVASLLAFFALVGLNVGWGVAPIWLFNVWGTADLLYAFYNVASLVRQRKLVSGQFGAAYFIPTCYVPLLLITHGVVFWVLIRGTM